MPDTTTLERDIQAPPYATLNEAATYTRLSPQTLRRAIADGRLRAFKASGRVLVTYPDLDRLVMGQG